MMAQKVRDTDFIPANAASNTMITCKMAAYYSGNYQQIQFNYWNKLFEGYLSYNKDIKSIKSHVDAVAGYSIQDFTKYI